MGLVEIISFLLVFCFIGLVVSMFIARILAWFLSRLMPVSVEFEISGCNSLRDVNLKFRKGYIDTVFIGDVKLTLGRSLIKMWSTFVYSCPKLQLLICDIEVVIKKSEASIKEKKSQRSNSRRKGKLLLTISNIARFLSVCIKDIVVKVPKAIIEVKELRWDVLKDSGAEPFFNFCLHLMPLLVQLDPPEFSFSQSSDCRQTDDLIAGKEYFSILENNPAPIICDKISFACEFGYERERLTIWALDVSTGDITADLNEGLFLRTDAKSKSSADTDAVDGAIQDNSITKISKKKFPLESIKKSLFVFPEKASFSMAKVDVEFTHRGEDLSFHNCILGINLSSSKSKSTEDIEEDASQIVLQLDLNEIHLLKGGEASVMEMLKLSFNASVDAPMQENKPIKVGANMKVGATHCNLLLKRLSRFLKLRSSAKKKWFFMRRLSLKKSLKQLKERTSCGHVLSLPLRSPS